MRKKRVLIFIPVILIGIMMVGVMIMFLSLQANMKEIQEIPIKEIDLNRVSDGTYVGTYYYEDQIGATLEVVVLNHEITEINVMEHICGKGAIAEDLLSDIVLTQSLDVDDVAGATTSSHVLKLSVQDALKENNQ